MAGHDIFVIGASAGGVEALIRVFRGLPADFPGTLFVVLHMSAESPGHLPQILSRAGELRASHPEDGEPWQAGRIYVAPPDHHLLLEEGYMRVVRGPRENRHRPAIDPLFRSAARAYSTRVVGIILTGVLDDGTAGMKTIKQRGGLTIIQDPQEAQYPDMPRNAQKHVAIDSVLSLDEMGPHLVSLAIEPVEQAEVPQTSSDLNMEVQIAEMEVHPLQEQEQLGKPSAFSCPECGGVLWEIDDPDLLRFRCRTGHAFSAESVLVDQTELIEKALWTALKTLEEKVSLSRRMAAQARQRGNTWLAQQLLERIESVEQDATLLQRVLRASSFSQEQKGEMP